MAIADYLAKLVELKNQLVANLNIMGITADESEKLNTLVPKVLECETEQNVEWSDGFKGTIRTNYNLTKYIDTLRLPNGITNIYNSDTNRNSETMFTYIKHLILPSTLLEIGDGAFSYYASVLETIFIPKSVTNIGINALGLNTYLAHIYYEGTEEEWNAINKGISWNYEMGKNVTGGTTIHFNYVPE